MWKVAKKRKNQRAARGFSGELLEQEQLEIHHILLERAFSGMFILDFPFVSTGMLFFSFFVDPWMMFVDWE